MRMLKFIKSFKDTLVNNVFVLQNEDAIVNVEGALRSAVQGAQCKVCFVLENGMNNAIAQMLYRIQARKYVIVPKIEEEKYKSLKGEIIAREVVNIKGNYAIIDAQKIFFFDEKFNGYIVANVKVADVIQQLFLKEFWENGEMEFIEDKRACAEVTFDVSPLYGNEVVMIDQSFDGETEVESLISGAKKLAFTQKAVTQGSEIIIKKAELNSDLLRNASNENIFLAKDLPCSLVFDGSNTYILNFDVAKYHTLPEKQQGRLFAIKCGDLSVGKTYKFFKHKSVEKLINKDVLSIDGNTLAILETAEEQRKITTDLRMAVEYEKMDADTLEARLEKKDPNIFNTDKYAESVTYNIAVEIAKRTMTGVAEVYGEYERAKEALRKKWNEVLSSAKQQKLEKKIEKYEVQIAGISTRTAYFNAVSSINESIKLLSNHGDTDIDESLSEVTGKNKQASIQLISAVDLKMDIPANGKLYQNKEKYEYVLTSEDKLAVAMEEMKVAGIENINIQYLAE